MEIPPPLKPLVPQDSASQAVSEPSFLAPTLILAKPEGRTPATNSSASRSRKLRTGRPVSRDSLAVSRPQLSAPNLLP